MFHMIPFFETWSEGIVVWLWNRSLLVRRSWHSSWVLDQFQGLWRNWSNHWDWLTLLKMRIVDWCIPDRSWSYILLGNSLAVRILILRTLVGHRSSLNYDLLRLTYYCSICHQFISCHDGSVSFSFSISIDHERKRSDIRQLTFPRGDISILHRLTHNIQFLLLITTSVLHGLNWHISFHLLGWLFIGIKIDVAVNLGGFSHVLRNTLMRGWIMGGIPCFLEERSILV